MVTLMFIGASPGGTGGGIKTTTFAVLLLTMRSTILGRYQTEIFERRIPHEIVRRAMTIVFLSLGLVLFTTAIVTMQGFSFGQVLFEATSAFGTVGLTMGITPQLNVFSKLMIAITMFIGRVGTLTLFAGLTLASKDRRTGFPKEEVSIG